MRDFLQNLLLSGLGLIVIIFFPQVLEIFGVYNALGILPFVIVIILLAALPRRRSRRRDKPTSRLSSRYLGPR